MGAHHERLAKMLVATNGHLRTFDVQLLDAEEAACVKVALEELGCVVTIEADGISLQVVCPQK